MRLGRRLKQALDILIVLCGISLVYYILKEIKTWRITPLYLAVVFIGRPEGPIKPEEMFAAFFGTGNMREAEKRNASGKKT